MKTWQLVFKEIRYRRLSFILGLISVAVATAALSGALTMLKVYDLRSARIIESLEQETAQQMQALNRDVGKAMLKLGWNVLILPAAQDMGEYYADDQGEHYIPEAYVEKLASSGIVTVRHFLPTIQQKVKWPERKRKIILVGTRGEVPNLSKDKKKPLIQPVPAGAMVVGYELHQSLGLKKGDQVRLYGREFSVHRLNEERGGKDDITVWIPLQTAQEIFNKPGQISGILALECKCALGNVGKIREEIEKVLPGTRVIEFNSRAIARAEAREKVEAEARATIEREKALREELRQERERLALIITILTSLAAGIWIVFLFLSNVRERRSEIGILRAQGFSTARIMTLFLSRAAITGLLGGMLGAAAGMLGGGLFSAAIMTGSLVFALVLSLGASWIPALLAAGHDPAETLREE